MPQLDAKLSQILDELQKAAAKYAPGALTLGLDTIRAVAIIHLLWAFFAFITLVIAGVIYVRTFWVWRLINRTPVPDDAPTILSVLNVAAAIIGIAAFIVFMANGINTINWLALVDPRLALAKMILDRVGLVP